MGGRSSSFKHSGAGATIGNLTGTKEQIAEAEKIRKPYIDALKKLDGMKDTMMRNINSDAIDKLVKGIRVARGETPENAIAHNWAFNFYDTNETVGKDIHNIRVKNSFTDWDIEELGQKINKGQVPRQAGIAEAHKRMNRTNRDLYRFFKSEGPKALKHTDADWWIKNKKNF